MKTLSKFFYFFAIAFAFVGAIGGAGYAGHQRQWVVMVCVLVLAAEAAPFVIHSFKQILK